MVNEFFYGSKIATLRAYLIGTLLSFVVFMKKGDASFFFKRKKYVVLSIFVALIFDCVSLFSVFLMHFFCLYGE